MVGRSTYLNYDQISPERERSVIEPRSHAEGFRLSDGILAPAPYSLI
jgi:hypothetical protein